MSRCLGCSATVEQVLSFGKMPIANGFLREDQFADEFFHNLGISFCPECSLVQLAEPLDPAMQYHENYAYFASTSARAVEHFSQAASQISALISDQPDPFVVEIGSNDGIMLRNFAKDGVRHLGVEPSENVAKEAIRNGISTKCDFFGQATATEILQEHGAADAIFGANVITHIPDIHSLLASVHLLLKDEGVFIIEDPYLGDIIEKTAYDQFYDEHVFYFCLTSLQSLLDQHGMTIVDAEPQLVHGGSMRPRPRAPSSPTSAVSVRNCLSLSATRPPRNRVSSALVPISRSSPMKSFRGTIPNMRCYSPGIMERRYWPRSKIFSAGAAGSSPSCPRSQSWTIPARQSPARQSRQLREAYQSPDCRRHCQGPDPHSDERGYFRRMPTQP
jgi:SAM-dependent methyltransferase